MTDIRLHEARSNYTRRRIVVNNKTELLAAVAAATGGERIYCNPDSSYSSITLQDKNFVSNPIALIGTPSLVTMFARRTALSNIKGVTFENIKFWSDQVETYGFLITANSNVGGGQYISDVKWNRCLFSSVGGTRNGCIIAKDVENLTVANCIMEDCDGFGLTNMTNAKLLQNRSTGVLVDWLQFAGFIHGMDIIGNYVNRYETTEESALHSDLTQGTSVNLTAGDWQQDVTVKYNKFVGATNSDRSRNVQGMLWKDEAATAGQIRRINVSHNLYVCPSAHGITLGFGYMEDVTIDHNAFIDPSRTDTTGQRIYIHDSDFHPTGNAANVNLTITNNVCTSILLAGGHETNQTNYVESGNQTVYSEYTWRPYVYGNIFLDGNNTDPDAGQDFSNWLPRPGGILDGNSVGPALALADVTPPEVYIDDDPHIGLGNSDTVDVTVRDYPDATEYVGTCTIDWGDGNQSSGPTASHQYAAGGSKIVTVSGPAITTVNKMVYPRKPCILDLRFTGGTIVDAAPRDEGAVALTWVELAGGSAVPAYGTEGAHEYAAFSTANNSYIKVDFNGATYWQNMRQMSWLFRFKSLVNSKHMVYASYMFFVLPNTTTGCTCFTTDDDYNNSTGFAINAGNVSTGTWYDLIVQFDGMDVSGPSMTTWLNGSQVGPNRNASTLLNAIRPYNSVLRLGAGYASGDAWTGYLERAYFCQGLVSEFPA